MKDKINPFYIILIIIIIILIIFYGRYFEQNKNQWNNGYCSCGGHWEYSQAVEDKDNNSIYIYRCDKCGKTIEVGEIQDFVVTIKRGG